MNRPTPVKTDNFFLLIFRALRHRRVPIALRIASHNVILVALALVIYACVMGLQFKQAMHEQADALGASLTTQTATSATELLVSNDILSLNVLLNNLTKNPLVAHAAIYSVDNRIMAEAGQRPKNGLLGEAEGLYQSNITFQDVKAGQLRISLDMQQFQQPMTISLQSMGILSAILLALALALSLRLGRHISTPLMQLRIWLRDIDEHTPATDRQDEIGDLARQLHTSFAPEPKAPEVEPEPEYDDTEDYNDEPEFEVRDLRDPGFDESAPVAGLKPAPRHVIKAEEDELDDEDPLKVKEARECIVAMIQWSNSRGKKSVGMGQSVLAGVLELIRAANAGIANAENMPTNRTDFLRRMFCRTEFERGEVADVAAATSTEGNPAR